MRLPMSERLSILMSAHMSTHMSSPRQERAGGGARSTASSRKAKRWPLYRHRRRHVCRGGPWTRRYSESSPRRELSARYAAYARRVSAHVSAHTSVHMSTHMYARMVPSPWQGIITQMPWYLHHGKEELAVSPETPHRAEGE